MNQSILKVCINLRRRSLSIGSLSKIHSLKQASGKGSIPLMYRHSYLNISHRPQTPSLSDIIKVDLVSKSDTIAAKNKVGALEQLNWTPRPSVGAMTGAGGKEVRLAS